jgi:hypothetical protein
MFVWLSQAFFLFPLISSFRWCDFINLDKASKNTQLSWVKMKVVCKVDSLKKSAKLVFWTRDKRRTMLLLLGGTVFGGYALDRDHNALATYMYRHPWDQSMILILKGRRLLASNARNIHCTYRSSSLRLCCVLWYCGIGCRCVVVFIVMNCVWFCVCLFSGIFLLVNKSTILCLSWGMSILLLAIC